MTKEEVLAKLKPLLKDELNIQIIKHLAQGLTPRQISNMGVCAYAVAYSKCKAIAEALGAEYGSLHRATSILQVLMVKRGGSN